jgi:hypothetical protein
VPTDIPSEDHMISEVVIQMGRDKRLIDRRVYTIFDWMNEVGGFYGFIQLLVSMVLPLFQVWTLEKTLIRKLFKIELSGPQKARKRSQDDA